MNSTEILKHLKQNSKLNVILAFYIYKDSCGIIQIGKSIPLDLRDYEESISTIERVIMECELIGFLETPEGDEWIKSNWDVVSKVLGNYMLHQSTI